MPSHVTEHQFESDIVESLTTSGGYSLGADSHFDKKSGVDTAELFAFLGNTQGEKWNSFVDTRYGGDAGKAQEKFLSRLVAELDQHGTIDVLRTGIKDQGVNFALVYFKPASGMNATLAELYAKNRLTVTRQLHYSLANANSLDLALFVNGIPVATAELKSTFNGQTVDHAIEQYESDRDPKELLLGRRALVHFAVDPHLAYMTTKLAYKATEFLPFNLGSNPGQMSCGEGNPPNPKGYSTSYLWERVWSYDAWLDILGRFVESFQDGKGKPRRVVFPRFHQWDAVTKLAADALANGPGNSYLIQHSAGSGKSNSIGWLAHRLSLLHDSADHKVFNKVIVVTDRRVLDEQLRATVRQFEDVKGTMVSVEGKSGSKSSELADALTGMAQIITVTLETFPYVITKIAEAELAKFTYAVIVDEAHSSQTGDAANALKQALGAGGGGGSEGEGEGEGEMDAEAALAAIVAARGRQPNLSFFAFTATPKARTVELFGVPNAEGIKIPFHLYTMRQAIEEKFIRDVLENYATYDTYFKLAATSEQAAHEEVDVRKAASAIRRYVARNPALIKQKAAIIVEHFREHTAKEIGGRAKAMVVTDSRPAAVKYKAAIDAHIAENHITDVKALVAFSGTVNDDVMGEVTESSLNGFAESQTAARFKGTDPFKPGDYQILIVAEKFQTGFDEPYLHTMFVDKPLKGLNAVQTLSRLNRIAPGKTSTFVLDFRNKAEDIQSAFQRYYEAVIAESTNPNVLYDLQGRMMGVGILDVAEINAASDAFFGIDPSKRSLKALYANVDPAVDRFKDLDDDDQAEFRDASDRFIRAYSFLSQVMPWTDPELERLYVYAKALAACLPAQLSGGLDLGTDVVLTHLRLVDRGAEEVDLQPGEVSPEKPFPGEGHAGGPGDPLLDNLSTVIEQINEIFGADLDERDRLEVEKIKMTLLDRQDLKTYATANSEENYALEFGPVFRGAVLDQEEHNRRLYELLQSKPDLAAMVEKQLMRETYNQLRADPPANTP
ncbi:MAG TPA: type I restriction endonuclease [Acidimicrobiales bacterium]|jgi:type I restriction enzyme R subunit|nr:type I restriction endonuclease [Acidimicrobiales bacterium]